MPLIQLITANKPQKITVADKPLRLGGNTRDLTPEQFEKEFGLEINEGLCVPEELFDTYTKLKEQPPQSHCAEFIEEAVVGDLISERIKNPFTDIAICHINEKVGFGVFALTNIKKLTVLGIYAGIFAPLMPHDRYACLESNYKDIKYATSAKDKGGLFAHFLQHLPTPEELEAIEFKDLKNKKQIQLENISPMITTYHGHHILFFAASTDIKAGDQLGFSYGQSYWRDSHKYPLLFNKNGGLLPIYSYERKYAHIPYYVTGNSYIRLEMSSVKIREYINDSLIIDVFDNAEPNKTYAYSIYQFRDSAVAGNLVIDRAAAIQALPTFALAIKGKFFNLTDLEVKAYYQKPFAPINTLDAFTVDIVCQAKTESTFKAITHFFKPLRAKSKIFEETKEIALTGTNVDTDEYLDFMKNNL